MRKIKDWYMIEQDVEATSCKVVKAFEKWYKGNLRITHGSGNNVELLFGLPYTSSSDYAALWNCQAEAELKADPQWKFNALAISEDREILVVFDREDTGNFDEKEIVIGKLPIKDIYKEALKVMESDDIDHHESDLYLKVNDVSRKLIENYEWKGNVQIFNSAYGDGLWYDVPFAYSTYWEKKHAN